MCPHSVCAKRIRVRRPHEIILWAIFDGCTDQYGHFQQDKGQILGSENDEMVQDHPEVYDQRLPEYKYTDISQNIWESIATALEIDDTSCVAADRGVFACMLCWVNLVCQTLETG